MEIGPTPEELMQLGMGFWGSKTLLSPVELGVFTKLAKGPLDAEALSQRIGISQRSVRDFYDALVSLGMLHRKSGRYLNTEETDLFVDRSKPSYLRGSWRWRTPASIPSGDP